MKKGIVCNDIFKILAVFHGYRAFIIGLGLKTRASKSTFSGSGLIFQAWVSGSGMIFPWNTVINHNNIKSKTEKCAHQILLLIYMENVSKYFIPNFQVKIVPPHGTSGITGKTTPVTCKTFRAQT